MIFNQINKWLYTLDGIMTVEECQELIEVGKASMTESTVVGAQRENYRHSETGWVERDHTSEIVRKISYLSSKLTQLPVENQEKLSIIKYSTGDYFKSHYDFLCSNDPESVDRYGDRLWSLIFYLNDNFLGGKTEFPKIKTQIDPKLGRVVIFKNYINDLPNMDSMHSGLEVTKGTKYICTVWVRKFEFW